MEILFNKCFYFIPTDENCTMNLNLIIVYRLQLFLLVETILTVCIILMLNTNRPVFYFTFFS